MGEGGRKQEEREGGREREGVGGEKEKGGGECGVGEGRGGQYGDHWDLESGSLPQQEACPTFHNWF